MDFERGQVLVCDLPWVDPEALWSFSHWERPVEPKRAGEGVGLGDSFPWPRDYSGQSARVYLVEADARSGKTTSGAYSFPAESLRPAAAPGSGVRIGGGKGRTVRLCSVEACGRTYAGTAEPLLAEAAGLTVVPDRAGKVPLCRRHRSEVLG
jgi:hypothetical protein